MTIAPCPHCSDSTCIDPAGAPARATTRPALRSAATIAAHFVIDMFSFVGVSLLPLLMITLGITTAQKALLLGLGSLCSGAIQPVVAWASDRYDTRALGTLGFVVAVLCISSFGYAHSFTQLAVLYCLGTMGVGAYHPPAAATVGQLAGNRRSLMIAVFFLAGMCGGIMGNMFTPRFVSWMSPVTDHHADTAAGLRALLWYIPLGLGVALLLGRAIHKVGHRRGDAADHLVSLDRAERRRRWGAVGVLYLANTLRFSVNMALVYLLSEWASAVVLSRSGQIGMTEQLGLRASQLNGMLQASMQVGMGGFGILLGFTLAARFEKLVFVALPLLGSGAVYMVPRTAMISESMMVPVAIGATVLCGVGFGAVIPVSISLAQRLLPHRTSLASGLMLGGAWTLAFCGPLLAELVQKGLANKPNAPGFVVRAVESLPARIAAPIMDGMGLTAAFTATAIALLCAGLISLMLPHKLVMRVAKD